MITFAARIRKEQPGIRAALADATNTLPVWVKPVAHHVLGQGGKRLRPLLTIFVARLLGYREPDIYPSPPPWNSSIQRHCCTTTCWTTPI